MITTGKINVIFDEEFENIFMALTIKDFNSLGFSFGDSVNITFDNGVELLDVPYYSGYYGFIEQLQLTGYPGDPYIKLARNCGNPTWYEFKMKDNTIAEISLEEKAKYIEVQELFSLEYSNYREDFSSDEIYSNFRELKGGNIKEHYFYRSTSPCDNLHNRASFTDNLIKQHGIRCVLNLSNNEKRYEAFVKKDDFNSPYYDSLYRSGNVLLLQLNVNYHNQEFQKKLANGFMEMTKHEGPVLAHCMEGKDRTGFVSAMILSLAGASYQDIINDYMLTYSNYYNITKESNPKKYEAILDNVYDFLYNIAATKDFRNADLKLGAENYLKKGGLSDSQIKKIEDFINK